MAQPNVNAIMTQPLSATPKSQITLTTYVGTATAVGTYTIPEGQNSCVCFNIANLAAETVAVQYGYDGTNFTAIGNVVSRTTGLDVAGATLTNGSYILPEVRFGAFKYLKFIKSNTANTVVVAVAVASPQNYF